MNERPEEIERRLAEDRAQIGDTIDAIQRRLSPGHMLDQALGYVRTGGGEAVSTMTRSVRSNPWPLVLTGISLAWLMRSTSASRNHHGYYGEEEDYYASSTEARAVERAQAAAASIQRRADETEEAFQERLTEAKAKAIDLTRQAQETAQAFRERIEAYLERVERSAADLRERARRGAHRAGAAVGRGTDALGDAVTTVTHSVRSNPLPLVLTGLGLVWLARSSATSRNHDGYYREDGDYYASSTEAQAVERAQAAAASIQRRADETEEAFQERLTEAKAKAIDLTRQAQETAHAFRERVQSYIERAERSAADLRDRARRGAHRAGAALERGSGAVAQGARRAQDAVHGAQHRAKDIYESDPLVAAAVGVAAGALIGALWPATATERRLMGEYGDELRHRASDIANEAMDRTKAAAAEGVHAATEAADAAVHGKPARNGDGADRAGGTSAGVGGARG